MALNDAIAAIRARADSLWPGIEASVPLAWPNEDFERPYADVGGPQPFVVIEPRWNGGVFQSIGSPGSNWTRREGHIWVYAFIPMGQGSERAHELVAKAGGMYEGQDFGGVVCWALEPGGLADSEDGAYFGQAAAIPFNYDETA